jgi:hypothetical protein
MFRLLDHFMLGPPKTKLLFHNLTREAVQRDTLLHSENLRLDGRERNIKKWKEW